jgi:hypothetical protein
MDIEEKALWECESKRILRLGWNAQGILDINQNYQPK